MPRVYQRPNWFLRLVAGPIVAKLGLTSTLAVRGRKTGEWRTIPVNVLSLAGERYILSPRGETEWVRNLRTAGTGEVRRAGRTEPFRATELPVDDRAPIIAAYRNKWDWQVRAQFDAMPDPKDHPVFRLEPA